MIVQKIKSFAKNNRFLNPYYEKIKVYVQNRPLYGKYKLEDRSKGSRQLCIILAGYKNYLYPAVLGRVAKYAPNDIYVCVCSSGVFSDELSRICKEHDWSYLSTKRNNVSLIQNIAIRLHPKAEYIYKLDEDIFITENYFEHLMNAYKHAEGGDYFPGVLAPLIPVNGYGNCRVLEKLGLSAEYEKRFERPKYQLGRFREIEKNPEAVQFVWGRGGVVPSIDEINARFASESLEERPCAIRFSIGAILFKRSFWKEMGYFPVEKRGTGMGGDEAALCKYCCMSSQPLMVSENVVVGHLSFGLTNQAMKEYFLSNQNLFMPR